jgi:hypothetical protein
VFVASMPNAEYLAASLDVTAAQINGIGLAMTEIYGRELQAAVKAHASGRPGPNVITGEYRDSIMLKITESLTGVEAEVYSDAPQAFRLEYGFVGSDSLGRHYDQPPFPHFRPALQQVGGEYHVAVSTAIRKAIR